MAFMVGCFSEAFGTHTLLHLRAQNIKCNDNLHMNKGTYGIGIVTVWDKSFHDGHFLLYLCKSKIKVLQIRKAAVG